MSAPLTDIQEAAIDTALLVASIRICGALFDNGDPKVFNERFQKLRHLSEEVAKRQMERKK